MLTSNLVRVRFHRQRVIPRFIDPGDPEHRAEAERLIGLFDGREGSSRNEIDDELQETLGDDSGQFIRQGLIKLLEDRCDFETVAGLPPADVREEVFRLAAAARAAGPFDRLTVIAAAAGQLGVPVEQIEATLFADLKSEQRLSRFRPISPERLLEHYNVALVQGIVLKAVSITADIHHESPARLRRLCRLVKFHRLICEATSILPQVVRLKLDGPMSLFSATQKYGLQLSLFLPAILQCQRFQLVADLRWGPERKPLTLELSHEDRLVVQASETGTYVPPELGMFVEQFRAKQPDWDLSEEVEIRPLGSHFWVPDFRLTHRPSGRLVYLEVLGFWRKSSAEAHLKRLAEHAREPFVLALSEQLKLDDDALESLPPHIVRFRNMPLPDEVARAALTALGDRLSG